MITFRFDYGEGWNEVASLYADLFSSAGPTSRYSHEIEEEVTCTIYVEANCNPHGSSPKHKDDNYEPGRIDIFYSIIKYDKGWPKQENEAKTLDYSIEKAINEYKKRFGE